MLHKVRIGDKRTDLQVFVGTMTQFKPADGRLCCRDIIIVADTPGRAREIAESNYPEWTLQSLTSLSTLPWFIAIYLDGNCPQVAEMREFLMEHIIDAPLDDI